MGINTIRSRTVLFATATCFAALLCGCEQRHNDRDIARTKTTTATMYLLRAAIKLYFQQNGAYPPTLQAMRETTPPLIATIGTDGWKEEFVYSTESTDPKRPFTLFSKGRDRIAGTNDDLSVWETDE